MRSPIERLTVDERAILATFHSSEEFRVLCKLIEMERLDLAKDHVDQTDILHVRYLSGQVQGLKKLVLTIKQLHKSSKEG